MDDQRIDARPPWAVSVILNVPGPPTDTTAGSPDWVLTPDAPPVTVRVFVPDPVPVTVRVVPPGQDTDAVVVVGPDVVGVDG